MKQSGVWITGRMDTLEFHKFQSLMRTAMQAVAEGKHFSYEDPLIRINTFIAGDTGHIFYTWKYPPKEYWSKETKTPGTCLLCLPEGLKGEAAREVWCTHPDYRALQCPYGVPTPYGVSGPAWYEKL